MGVRINGMRRRMIEGLEGTKGQGLEAGDADAAAGESGTRVAGLGRGRVRAPLTSTHVTLLTLRPFRLSTIPRHVAASLT